MKQELIPRERNMFSFKYARCSSCIIKLYFDTPEDLVQQVDGLKRKAPDLKKQVSEVIKQLGDKAAEEWG